MKKNLLFVMLLSGIISQTFAQSSKDQQSVFELQHNPFQRRFTFDLGKRDKMDIEISSMNDLHYLLNIDSIVQEFITDMEPLQDSILREPSSRKIEYAIDGPNLKRISLVKHNPPVSNFVISFGEMSMLKVVQDTIIINGILPVQPGGTLFNKKTRPHYYRISFFLNDLNGLSTYKGHLNEKLGRLLEAADGKWVLRQDGKMYIKSEPDISAQSKRGYSGGSTLIAVRPSIDVQNYKNYFVTSLSGGIAFVNNKNLMHKEYFVGYEKHFLFAGDTAGKIKTFANNFIVASYGQGAIDPYTKKTATLYPFISLGYLVKRKGDFYDKHTFKLGLGQFNLFGNYTKIEPTLFFNNFFRGCTPSLRITQHF